MNFKNKIKYFGIITTTLIITLPIGVKSVNAFPATVHYVPNYGVRLFDDEGYGTNQLILDGTTWEVYGSKQDTNGNVYYNLGKNEWARADYLVDTHPIPENKNYVTASGNIGTTNPPYVSLNISSHQNNIAKQSESSSQLLGTLPSNTNWKAYKIYVMFGSGNTYYNLGGNQWLYSWYISSFNGNSNYERTAELKDVKVDFVN